MIKAIDRLFKRLSATYGASWDRSMGATPEIDSKTVWAHELSGFKNSLHRVAWALENLPERCPNVIEFKNLCRMAPMPDVPQLPATKADPARVQAELEKLGPLLSTKFVAGGSGWRDWAHALKAKDELNPRSVTPTIRKMYQDALKESAA